MSFPAVTIEGYPRIGAHRELKKALEAYWSGAINKEDFVAAAHSLRVANYARLVDLGLTEDYAIPADVAYYDQVLETALTVGLIPGDVDLDEEFALCRGTAERSPLEMTKWFDTNYHYLVPEVADAEFTPRPQRVVAIADEARAAGVAIRPYLVGPVTLLALSKAADDAELTDPLDRLDDAVDAYAAVLAQLAQAGVEWVQLTEPALVADLGPGDAALADHARRAYTRLLAAPVGKARPNVLVSTPYGSLRAGLDALADVAPEAVHVDLAPATLAADPDYARRVGATLSPATRLVAGLIDGRNVWAANLDERARVLDELATTRDAVSVSTSVSLQHVPHTVADEPELPVDVACWLAFADEKITEAVGLSRRDADAFARSARAVRTRSESRRTHDAAVAERVAALPAGEVARTPDFAGRQDAQQALGLPPLPSTTIGSFPQTPEIRAARAAHRAGTLSDEDYTAALRAEITSVVALQEEIGLDVLVHGEPERNDMVQYFAELLDGFVTTVNGWVQSYGSRCTRPPIVIGDVSRPKPMTVEWSAFAQSLTSRPVKGMLTGPVTILAWSFNRDDVPLSVSADQIALALADEVRDLEDAGISIIQIDEPALRELLPLRADARPAYLDWSIRAFRLVSLDARPETQIHTHLCYSEFGQIIDAVAALDADVTSIEAARSRMELLVDLNEGFHSEIGPGIWDIHSPRVPSVDELTGLIEAALRHVPAERLWINPDCGLKTRRYAETIESLKNMIAARSKVLSAS
ncbi:5-methyltetrahydropteroyltriglutamate--homocysteine S-methyltransferase [Corynebacterium uterequi]|uniref:5-methyltetrahydropteroyltriglutamate--homocysteine S-methyltransferase n=1 Tax=Corynebacterium uterequi TaxID=1072256 RepID=A0A0G3HDL8_9CORY|nr:5-methyltetrahydropteroyltriglutamate--homocysteine S-methyltransferase [Corynebacterium uterequi]AKK10063.1 methionine synthase (B12-independent) [Corynebacterium uterequi]